MYKLIHKDITATSDTTVLIQELGAMRTGSIQAITYESSGFTAILTVVYDRSNDTSVWTSAESINLGTNPAPNTTVLSPQFWERQRFMRIRLTSGGWGYWRGRIYLYLIRP